MLILYLVKTAIFSFWINRLLRFLGHLDIVGV
jgi:hypothetical protein